MKSVEVVLLEDMKNLYYLANEEGTDTWYGWTLPPRKVAFGNAPLDMVHIAYRLLRKLEPVFLLLPGEPLSETEANALRSRCTGTSPGVDVVATLTLTDKADLAKPAIGLPVK